MSTFFFKMSKVYTGFLFEVCAKISNVIVVVLITNNELSPMAEFAALF